MKKDDKKQPDTLAERSRRHRAKRKAQGVQLAMAIAQLIETGLTPDQKNLLKEFILANADQDQLDEPQMRTIDRALDKLSSRFSRL